MGSRSRFACSCVPPCGSLWVSRVVGLGLGTSTACRSCTGMSNMGRQPACSKGGRTPQLLLPVACLKKTFRKRPSSLAAESILPELPFSHARALFWACNKLNMAARTLRIVPRRTCGHSTMETRCTLQLVSYGLRTCFPFSKGKGMRQAKPQVLTATTGAAFLCAGAHCSCAFLCEVHLLPSVYT